MKKAFQINLADNVATMCDDATAEPVQIVGAPNPFAITLIEPAHTGHKVAIAAIEEGHPIVKFGVPIGIATRDIHIGEWVHLHNCRSQVDERSSTLDVETGAATDIAYE